MTDHLPTQNNDTSPSSSRLVIIDYQDLLLPHDKTSTHSKLHPLLTKAFGSSKVNNITSSSPPSPSLGLIAIRNIPSFIQAKASFLPLAHQLIKLPQSYLNSNHLTDPSSFYNAGWSYGKEKLKNNLPDLSKGSFYFNPVVDVPGSKYDRETYPASYPVNKWPDEDRIPNFKLFGTQLGLLMKDVVVLLALHIDAYVKKLHCRNHDDAGTTNMISIGEEMKYTEKVKGRLLYYFPHDVVHDHEKVDETKKDDHGGKSEATVMTSTEAEYDSWIGWHNDSGFLTALAGDIYVDHDTGDIIPKEDIDPDAGLYIQDRNGTITHIHIPDDCMAIQIGECLQIVTGGYVVATPHCVKGADPNWRNRNSSGGDGSSSGSRSTSGLSCDDKKRRVARISFPCFVDTVPSFPLSVPNGVSREDVLCSSVDGCAKVPPLEKRWITDGMDFGSFLQKTFALYYDWINKT